jgi:asparagine synthetase B (glutamine-hydrolysing)
MRHPIEQPPLENLENHQAFFKRIEKANILPTEKSEWSLEELKQNFDDVFQKYGAIALEKNNGKIFTTLSGGLDSSLALAFLRKNFPKEEIITFSMGGSEKHPDILHARLAAEKFGSKHNEFIPTADEIQEALMEYKDKFKENNFEKITKTGDVDVYLLYKYISKFHPNIMLVHDGIDELMGGYWDHRDVNSETERKDAFTKFWQALVPDHLVPLIKTSDNFDIDLLFPYLDSKIIENISRIPLNDRTSKELSKIQERKIAQELGVPEGIINRQKRGQVGMLDRE